MLIEVVKTLQKVSQNGPVSIGTLPISINSRGSNLALRTGQIYQVDFLDLSVA